MATGGPGACLHRRRRPVSSRFAPRNSPSGAFLDLCDTIAGAAAPYDAAVIVNDRVDLALMSRAAGVHVGQDDLPPAEGARLLGADAVVGVSTHTPRRSSAALREPITYIAVGPVFATRTKDTGYQAVGLEFVSAVGAHGRFACRRRDRRNHARQRAVGDRRRRRRRRGDQRSARAPRRARPDARLPSSARSTSRIVASDPVLRHQRRWKLRGEIVAGSLFRTKSIERLMAEAEAR